MLKGKNYNSYDQLIDMINDVDKNFDKNVIDKAYHFALEAHGDQKRKTGEPYILHPISVACILVELGMDTDSIVAALLHDVVEDTDVELETIKKKFGQEIANLIDGVTKIGKIPLSSREEQQAENIRKMLIAMADDIRVIIIKLADRLNNMRTIDCMSEQKRRDKALETMEVYAPIAHRLGIRAIKEEMEDISLRYLDPVAYKEIEDTMNLKKSNRQEFIEKTKKNIMKRVSKYIPNVHLEGRVKSVNGIYRKVFVQGKSIEEIYDIYAVRVIVDTVNDCYNILGIIHDIYTPLPNRFKDYISTPKPNFYQSLHTTVIGGEGIPFEVQIRTWEMHHTAEYGIAAHWKYKLGGTVKKDNVEKCLTWIRQMLENQKDSDDATDLVRNIKYDLGSEEVFVFTPKGDVISLPQGATVIDFAYAIHSAVGNRMVGAKVDRRIVPIDYKMKTGEIVEIMTTKEVVKGPSRDWLKIVKTSEARNKIRQWFKKEKREENIIEGKLELEKELKRNNINLNEADMQNFLQIISKKRKCNSIEDLYASIGYGGTQVWRIMPRVKDEYLKNYSKESQKHIDKVENKNSKNKESTSSGIIVDGIDNCLIKFSKCCNPLPGDDIIGFITRGYGVSVHKRNCTNVPKDIESFQDPKRWIPVRWADKVKEKFATTLEIVASDRTGLLADITLQLSSMHIFIHSLNSRHTDDNHAIVYATITINDIEHLKNITSRLSKIKGITSIKRS